VPRGKRGEARGGGLKWVSRPEEKRGGPVEKKGSLQEEKGLVSPPGEGREDLLFCVLLHGVGFRREVGDYVPKRKTISLGSNPSADVVEIKKTSP